MVAEDHRLALLGLIGSKKSVKEDDITDNNDCLDHSDDGWKSVRHKKKQKNASEKILKEDNPKNYNKNDFEELNEEVSLSNSKANGHRRVDPSAPSDSFSKEKEMVKCSWKNCGLQLESQGLLIAHMNEHLLEECKDESGKKISRSPEGVLTYP